SGMHWQAVGKLSVTVKRRTSLREDDRKRGGLGVVVYVGCGDGQLMCAGDDNVEIAVGTSGKASERNCGQRKDKKSRETTAACAADWKQKQTNRCEDERAYM
ncbi:MAG: hypothetical protein QOJ51_167, partial [Acidobacteriaceae bacterium]|nr:hypothetical protein [Acidobacteriaceae bacterium]